MFLTVKYLLLGLNRKQVKRAGHAAGVVDVRNAHTILCEKTTWETQL